MPDDQKEDKKRPNTDESVSPKLHSYWKPFIPNNTSRDIRK